MAMADVREQSNLYTAFDRVFTDFAGPIARGRELQAVEQYIYLIFPRYLHYGGASLPGVRLCHRAPFSQTECQIALPASSSDTQESTPDGVPPLSSTVCRQLRVEDGGQL